MGTEPSLQSVIGEQFEHRTTNREDGAQLDIVTQSFWGRDRQCAFFDVGVFNRMHLAIKTPHYLTTIESEKKREYE